ncbi:MAG: zinc metallopeptidase [Clostridiales bacterium]|nr:zinc metallopeptidase [Clostridiales bacterium]
MIFIFYGYGYDPSFLIVIPAVILMIYANFKVNLCIKKFSKIKNKKEYTGAQIARQLLMQNNIIDVEIREINGNYNDNYDPQKKVLNLSHKVYNGNSLTSVGIAAHEVGHAIQHNKFYFPSVMRNAVFPIVNFSSKLYMPLILLGLLFSFGSLFLLKLGIILFSTIVLFQIITLPVELNASKRATKLLIENNLIEKQEIKSIKKVLNAAALTYVASALYSILTLLRYIAIFNDKDK